MGSEWVICLTAEGPYLILVPCFQPLAMLTEKVLSLVCGMPLHMSMTAAETVTFFTRPLYRSSSVHTS